MTPAALLFAACVFSQSQQWLTDHDDADIFCCQVYAIARRNKWVSGDRLSTDGILIHAWGIMTSDWPKEASPGDVPEPARPT